MAKQRFINRKIYESVNTRRHAVPARVCFKSNMASAKNINVTKLKPS